MHTDILDRMGPNEILRVRRVLRESPSLRAAALKLRMSQDSAKWLANRLEMPVTVNHQIIGSHQASNNRKTTKGPREADDAADRLMARIEGRLPLQARMNAVRRAEMYGMAAMQRRAVAEAQFAALAARERAQVEAAAERARLDGQRRRQRKKAPKPDPEKDIALVIDLACAFYEVKAADLVSPSHERRLVIPRMAIAHACRAMVDKASTVRIGKALNRDHSTIVHALRKDPAPFQPFIDYCREVMA